MDIKYTDFLKELNKSNPKFTHQNIFAKVKKIVSEVTYGLAQQIQELKKENLGSGIYGLDFMADHQENLKLLEMTVSPDCERAQRDYPNFWNEIFETLVHAKQSTNLERII